MRLSVVCKMAVIFSRLQCVNLSGGYVDAITQPFYIALKLGTQFQNDVFGVLRWPWRDITTYFFHCTTCILTCVKKILRDYVYIIILHVYIIILHVYIIILHVYINILHVYIIIFHVYIMMYTCIDKYVYMRDNYVYMYRWLCIHAR